MARLSMSEITTYRWSFEDDVAHYAAARIPGIGVWRQKLSDYGEEKGIELLAESQLDVSNLLWAGGFTGSDGRTLRESIDDAAEAIRQAAAMQAGCLVVYTGARAGHTRGHARRLVQDALKELVPLAEQLDMTMAIEPMHPGCALEWTFLTGVDDTLDLLDAIGSPRLQMVFDTYHLGLNPRIVDRLNKLAGRIAIVHLGDGRRPCDHEQDRTPLGEGTIPLKEIVAALSASGYDGYYDVELIGQDVEAANYHELIEQSKQFFAQLGAGQVV